MFVSLLFHRVGEGKYATPLDALRRHLLYLKRKHPIVLPGQKAKGLGVCITFDDAYFDFYHYVFPILKESNIKVVLAVSPAYILQKSSTSAKERLENKTGPLPHDRPTPSDAFCSWDEIEEMQQSGLVQIASHGTSHVNLCDPAIDIEEEICNSKTLIEKNINTDINHFVYPMGRFNDKIHKIVRDNYRYVFRIGSAMNFSWDHPYQMVYRIPADNISDISTILSPIALIAYSGKYLLNRFRIR